MSNIRNRLLLHTCQDDRAVAVAFGDIEGNAGRHAVITQAFTQLGEHTSFGKSGKLAELLCALGQWQSGHAYIEFQHCWTEIALRSLLFNDRVVGDKDALSVSLPGTEGNAGRIK